MAGPQAIALAFSAASTAVAGLGYLSSRNAAKNQFMVDSAAIELNQEQARFKAAEAAQQNALSFRKALASQVALASMRGGAGSVVRQFGSESYSNFLQDQEAIKRGIRLNDASAQNQRAGAAGQKYASDLSALTRFAKSGLDAWNINDFSKMFPKGGT